MHDLTEKILIYNQNRPSDLTAIKFRYMRENLFRFFRGTSHLFYEDLARERAFPPGPIAWISGDAHLENFGSFRADNDQVYFDLNDFDEAVLAPVTWEIVRLVCSIHIGFDSLGIEPEKAAKMARLAVRSYADTLAEGKAEYIEQATAQGIICGFLRRVSQRKRKRLLNKKTVFQKKKIRLLLDHPKHLKLGKADKRALIEHVQQWLKVDENSPYNYTVRDAAFRIAGTGSVGLERYVFILESLNRTGPKYMLLDMKEAAPSALQPFVPTEQPTWRSEAERVVSLQKRMQNRFPALLSISSFRNKEFIMQEMQPTKDNINFGLLKDRYRDMYSAIGSMAVLTASSHPRSTGQDGSCSTDELKSFGRRDDWQDAVLSYASRYASRAGEHFRQFLSDAPALQNDFVEK